MIRILLAFGLAMLLASEARTDEPARELLPLPKVESSILPEPLKVIPSLPILPGPFAPVRPGFFVPDRFGPMPPPPIVMGPLGPVRPGYFLPDRYAHWQFYAIDRQGYMKPRVILAPQPYYRYNGMPYGFFPALPQNLSNFPRPW